MEGNAAIAGADAAVAWHANRCVLSAKAGASTRIRTSSKLTMPETETSALNTSAERQYLLMANNDCAYHAAAQADFAANHRFGSVNASNYAATIGLVF